MVPTRLRPLGTPGMPHSPQETPPVATTVALEHATRWVAMNIETTATSARGSGSKRRGAQPQPESLRRHPSGRAGWRRGQSSRGQRTFLRPELSASARVGQICVLRNCSPDNPRHDAATPIWGLLPRDPWRVVCQRGSSTYSRPTPLLVDRPASIPHCLETWRPHPGRFQRASLPPLLACAWSCGRNQANLDQFAATLDLVAQVSPVPPVESCSFDRRLTISTATSMPKKWYADTVTCLES